MASDKTIIKQGYMLRWTEGEDEKASVWQPLFFVLYGPSPRNAARFDWYDTEEQFQQSPAIRKALFLEEIEYCRQLPYTRESMELYGSSAMYILLIHTYRKGVPNFVLKCDSQDELTEWQNHLTTLLQRVLAAANAIRSEIPKKTLDPNDIYNPDVTASSSTSSSYEVQVDDTAASARCQLKGSYRLLLSMEHITLVDRNSGNPVFAWAYKYIRRFGYCENSLSIEGGSKCGIAEGLFIFITDRGSELKKAINEQMQLWKMLQMQDCSNSLLHRPEESTPNTYSEFRPLEKKDRLTASNSYIVDEQFPLEKPVIDAAEQNGSADFSVPASQPLHMQTKMSEVLSMLSRYDLQGKEDDTYGYSHINLRGTVPKSCVTDDLENPYGVVRKIKNSK